jgi:polar amino acid transport system permease protein
VHQNSTAKGLKDLAGKKVGVVTGSTADDTASREFGKTNPDIRRFESTPVVVAELANGGLDAAIGDNGVIAFRTQEHKHLKTVADANFPKEYFGIVVKQGNKALLDKLNAGLAGVKADGTYAQIYKKWFQAERACAAEQLTQARGPHGPDAWKILWFGWFRADIIAEYGSLFWRGLGVTIAVTLICIVQGTALGLLIGMARLADARHTPARQLCRFGLRWPSTVYVSFFRGTPLFVQILLMHFAVMPLFINPADGLLIAGEAARTLKQEHGAFLSGVLALTLNAGAYISEIFRAGIQSIDRGQVEASRSLGLTHAPGHALNVVLPQAFRRMLPPLGNNAIALLKDSSLVSAIGLAELAYGGAHGGRRLLALLGAVSHHLADVLDADAAAGVGRPPPGGTLWTR